MLSSITLVIQLFKPEKDTQYPKSKTISFYIMSAVKSLLPLIFITAFKALYLYLECCQISTKIHTQVPKIKSTKPKTHTHHPTVLTPSLWKAYLIVDQCCWALENSTVCLFIHMLIRFYKKQWTDQNHNGTSYNPATIYPDHTPPLFCSPPLLSPFKGPFFA